MLITLSTNQITIQYYRQPSRAYLSLPARSQSIPAMAMELSSLRCQMAQLIMMFCLLLAGSVMALPALPGMDRVRWQVDRANRRGPSIGLVMSYVAEDTALQASGYFKPWPVQPFVDLYGRRFHIGSIRGVNVIYALTGQRRLNAAVTVQTLLDVFSVSGIVHYGTAGSSNDSMSFGDVSVPKLVAYTGAWTWKVNLERCNDTFCLPKTPQVVHGLKGASADMFLDNAEYRNFLFREFGMSTIDEESAAVVMTTTSPGVPVIVFRGVSDLAGGEPTWSSTSLMNLASINALKVTVEFIATIGRQKSTPSVQSSNN